MDNCAWTTICRFGKSGRWPLEENAWNNQCWKGKKNAMFMKWWDRKKKRKTPLTVPHLKNTIVCCFIIYIFSFLQSHFGSQQARFFSFSFYKAMAQTKTIFEMAFFFCYFFCQVCVFLQAFPSLIVLLRKHFETNKPLVCFFFWNAVQTQIPLVLGN